jgi:hypothetical protein
LLLAVPTLGAAQWMLGYAGWYDSHDDCSTFIFCVPWQFNLLLGPDYYLHFRSLTNQEFRLRPRAWWHLLPELLKIGLVAAYDLGWWHGIRGQPLPYHFGTKGPATQGLDGLDWLLSYPIYIMLPLYSWLVLRAYCRYTRGRHASSPGRHTTSLAGHVGKVGDHSGWDADYAEKAGSHVGSFNR